MFDFFLNSALSIGEKLSIGGQVTLLGMGTVFAVLVLLWVLVEVLHMLLGHKTEKKPVVVNKVEAPAPAPVTPSVPVENVVTEPSAEDNLAIIAVITAAVAAASGQSPSSFRVVSFKRANNKFSYRK